MSLIFKKGAITWTNGTFLSAEHLKDERNFLLSQVKNIQYIMHNYTHVSVVKFNEVALNRNSLEVSKFEGLMNNMQYLEYDSSWPTTLLENGETTGKIYDIKEDLTQYSKLIIEKQGLIFHLIVDGDYDIIDSFIDSTNNSAIVVNKTIAKLKLIPEHMLSNKVSIPICRIIHDEAGLTVDETYIPPTVFIKQEQAIYEPLLNLAKNLRSSLLEKAADFLTTKKTEDSLLTKSYAALYYSTIMPSVLNLETAINSQAHPQEVFALLQSILGSLSLLRFVHMPSSNIYNHLDIYASLQNLISAILGINNSMTKDGERILMDKGGNGDFLQDIPADIFIDGNHTYFILEMKDERERSNMMSWIEEARICGDNLREQLLINRVRGVERAFKEITLFGNNMLIVELNVMHSKYINMQSKKIILFNHFSGGYEPMSVSIYWRSGELS